MKRLNLCEICFDLQIDDVEESRDFIALVLRRSWHDDIAEVPLGNVLHAVTGARGIRFNLFSGVRVFQYRYSEVSGLIEGYRL